MGKILVHGERAEAPSRDSLEQRARELAEIDGRSPDNVTPDDRARAKQEILGRSHSGDEDGLIADDTAARDPSEPAAGSSGMVHKEETDDENLAAEEAVLSGVEEAEHEQMLEARRQVSEDEE